MDQSPRLLGISRELRNTIYDILAEEEDFTSLTQTCRQLRKEVFSRMPGSELVDYEATYDNETFTHQIRSSIDTNCVDIITEPWYSPGAALKIEARWSKTRGNTFNDSPKLKVSRWVIRDLSSPMARYAYLHQPKFIRIVFEAATSGDLQIALLTLRAKIFEIHELLAKFFGLWRNTADGTLQPKVIVFFRGGKDCSRPRLARKSFWEMRPRLRDNAERCPCIRCHRSGTVCNNKSHQGREHYPFFYECLLVPLFRFTEWRPDLLSFDIEPSKRHCSLVLLTKTPRNGNFQLRYCGVNTLWHYMLYAQAKNRETELHVFDDAYSAQQRRWVQLYGDANVRMKARLHNFVLDTPHLLANARSLEANRLRAYVLERRNADPRSPFALAWKEFVSIHLQGRKKPSPRKYVLERERTLEAYIGWACGFAPTRWMDWYMTS